MRADCLVALLLAVASLAAGCDKDSRECRAGFASTQELVRGIKADSPESLRTSVQALDGAIKVCDKAGLGSEKSELQKARNQIGAQLEVLERRAARKKKARPTPAELAELVAKGDPSCPKGQGYRSREAKQEIKCTGPQVIDMSFEGVRAYFAERNYKITVSDTPPTLRAEYGAELYVFSFEKPADPSGARCLEIYPAPGISWQELTSRMTGVDPEKLKPAGSLESARGPLAVSVEDNEKKTIARIGHCQG